MSEMLDAVIQIALVLFIAIWLLGMGLTLKLDDALAWLSGLWFGALFVVLGFGLSPVPGWLLRLDPAQYSWLLLLGLTPCAPLLATLADHTGCDKTLVAAILFSSVS